MGSVPRYSKINLTQVNFMLGMEGVKLKHYFAHKSNRERSS